MIVWIGGSIGYGMRLLHSYDSSVASVCSGVRQQLTDWHLSNLLQNAPSTLLAYQLANGSVQLDRVERCRGAGNGRMFTTVEAYKSKIENALDDSLNEFPLGPQVGELIKGYCTGRD